MKKWVDMGAEVNIEIGMEEIRRVLYECCAKINKWQLGDDPGPSRISSIEICRAFNQVGSFIEAVTDEQIALLDDNQREIISRFLSRNATRFAVGWKRSD